MPGSEKTLTLSQADIADYVEAMSGELSEMCENAQLDALATILYAAQLEARRASQRLLGSRKRRQAA